MSLGNIASGLRALFKRDKVDGDLTEELRGFLELAVEEKIKQGINPKEALRRVRLERGSLEVTKEIVRSAGWESVLETFGQDVRFGLRLLRKSPGFTAVALITLALGVGVNTTIFSFVDGILLRKPPVPDPDHLMVVSSRWAGNGGAWNRLPVSAPDFLDWRTRATAFPGMVAGNFDDYTISGEIVPERVEGARVSAEFFQTLGVNAALGRTIVAGEDQPGHDRVVVLSHGLWREKFARDPAILGRVIRVNGNSYVIVGVMPSSFRLWDFEAQLWIPLAFSREEIAPSGRKDRFLRVFARLKPGVTSTQAAAEMAAIAHRIAESHPETNQGWGAAVESVQQYSIDDANVKTAILFLAITVGFVLLIACANLANLLLARSLARRQEFAIRAALGAAGVRLTRQLLSECLILSFTGGALGALLAYCGLGVLRRQMSWSEGATSLAQTLQLDVPALIFTLALSAASAFIFGLLPAVLVSRTDLNDDLKQASRITHGRERRQVQRLLVVGQVALALVLLTGASLFLESFLEEIRAAPGFNTHNVLTASLSLRGSEYHAAPRREAAFFGNALRNLLTLAEVESAAVTSDLPFSFPNEKNFLVEGQAPPKPDEPPRCGYFVVSPGYFATLQVPLLQGREFQASDNAGSNPVVVVDRAFARRYFPGRNPIGRHIKVIETGQPKGESREIIGVVGDVAEFLGQRDSRPHFFEPFLAYPTDSMNFVVRTRSISTGVSEALRSAIRAVDSNQAIARVRTMDAVIADAGQGDDLMAELMGVFAGIALALAALGIYGVVSYMAEQRAHEMGVRITLGAKPSQAMGLMIRSGMSIAGIGTALGFSASLALPKLVSATFNGFHASPATALAAAPAVVTVAVFLACYVPARRAMRVDPVVALRHE
jgi:putative ABC transport system permease protein